MLQLTDLHNNTLMVELANNGSYYTINTAGAFKMSYGRNREIVHDRHTPVTQPAEVAEESQKPTQNGTSDKSRMNSSTQSDRKVTNAASDKQAESANTSQGALSASPQHSPDKRQAEREDGQLLILPSETSEEAGALSGPTFDSPY